MMQDKLFTLSESNLQLEETQDYGKYGITYKTSYTSLILKYFCNTKNTFYRISQMWYTIVTPTKLIHGGYIKKFVHLIFLRQLSEIKDDF